MERHISTGSGNTVTIIAMAVTSTVGAAVSRSLPALPGIAASMGVGAVVGAAARWWAYRVRLREYSTAERDA